MFHVPSASFNKFKFRKLKYRSKNICSAKIERGVDRIGRVETLSYRHYECVYKKITLKSRNVTQITYKRTDYRRGDAYSFNTQKNIKKK